MTSLSDEEKAEIANQVNLYKELRPVVQLGNQYRLINPDAASNEEAVQFNYGNQTIVTYVRVLSVVETMETTLKLERLRGGRGFMSWKGQTLFTRVQGSCMQV